MSAIKNWSVANGRAGTAVTVTETSQRVQLGSASDLYGTVSEDVLVDNPGPNDVYIAAGDATVTATTLNVRVPAGGLFPYSKGTMQHLALISKAGQTQAVVVHVGEGQ